MDTKELLIKIDPWINLVHTGLDKSVVRISWYRLSEILRWVSYEEAVANYTELKRIVKNLEGEK